MIEKRIIDYISRDNYIPLSKEELTLALNIQYNSIKEFYNVLDLLVKHNKLELSNENKYQIKNIKLTGEVEFTSKGNAFFISDEVDEEDIFIDKKNLNGANHKDRVEIEIIKKRSNNSKSEGKVIKVLNRVTEKIIGTFTDNKNFGFVEPDDIKINYDIFINKGDFNGAKSNDKVVCKITKFPDNKRNPEGVITEVLGNKDSDKVKILSLLKQYNVPYKFPKKVINEVELIDTYNLKKEIKTRADFRSLFTVTIDGEDSKDFDDAISIEKNGNDFILYTHIADVSYFVKKDSKIDNEALLRGNSLYLLNDVIPMLPSKLSNELCSLNPNKDRLCLSLKMIIDKVGNIKEYKFYESVINSDYRLIYDDVTNYLNGDEKVFNDDNLKKKLLLMKDLNEILTLKREKRGTLDFDLPEVKFIFDKKNKVIDIIKKSSGIANKIIESFMICANEVVGRHFIELDYPIIYRVHKKPTLEKITSLNNLLKNFSLNYSNEELLVSKNLKKIIDKYKNTEKSDLINYCILRTMNKAEYTPDSDIHFGLASYFYCHFTSPIRRYADLTVHRSIKNYLHSDLELSKNYYKYLDITSVHINETENKSMEIERKLEDIKKVQYMKNKIGEVYSGMIVSITSFGMFIQLENTVEGLLRFENLTDDYYIFDEKSMSAIGKSNRNAYSIGMNVEIVVSNVNDQTNEIDFILNR